MFYLTRKFTNNLVNLCNTPVIFYCCQRFLPSVEQNAPMKRHELIHPVQALIKNDMNRKISTQVKQPPLLRGTWVLR